MAPATWFTVVPRVWCGAQSDALKFPELDSGVDVSLPGITRCARPWRNPIALAPLIILPICRNYSLFSETSDDCCYLHPTLVIPDVAGSRLTFLGTFVGLGKWGRSPEHDWPAVLRKGVGAL